MPNYDHSIKSLPKNWPSHLHFITNYHTTISPIFTSLPANPNFSPNHSLPRIFPFTFIKTVPPSHPAFPHFGLFARKTIPTSTHILDYLGELLPSSSDSDYTYSLYPYSIDAQTYGNEARFINDFRGIGQVNVAFIEYWHMNQIRIAVVSLKRIEKGEELLLTYGKGYWKGRIPV